MKLDERILNELESEQTEVPPRTGSIDAVIARGRRRKAIANGLIAFMSAAVVAAVVGATAWVAAPGGGTTDAAEQPETWTTYAEADGLTGSCACDLAVAADGTLWTVARDGVFRFDGSTWIEEPRPPGLRFGPGVAAAAGPDGSMWFAGGEEHGAAHFGDGSWTVIEPFDVDMWGGFNDVAVTSDGAVWMSEGEVLTRLYGDSFEQVDEGFQLIPGHEGWKDRPALIMSMAVGPDGSLWVAGGPEGTIEGRLYHLVGTDVTVVAEVDGQGPGTLLGVAPDGDVWLSGDFFGTAAGDVSFLLRFDGQAWTSFPIGGVVGAAFEADGTAWFIVDEVAGDDKVWRPQFTEPGAYRFDGETWTHFSVDDGLAGLDLTSAITTADGSIWFGTNANGVTRFHPGANPRSGTLVDGLGGGDPFSDDEWPGNITTTTAPRAAP